MAVTISVVNQKGGVGKTTTTVNLGAALADMGKRVLMIDIDPQSNLTTHLGMGQAGTDGSDLTDTEVTDSAELSEVDYESVGPTIYDVLRDQMPLQEVIVNRSENLDLVPSSLFLSAADLELGGVIGRELLLKKALASVIDQYDVVLIDCPPALGLLSLNALAAVEQVIVPVQSEYLALHGVRQLLDTVDQVKSVYNPSLSVGGVLICLHDSRRKLARAVADTIRAYFGDLVFETIIRSNVSLAEAPASGQTIFEYAPRSTGADDYRTLAKELINGAQEA